jgi:signal transduction histidine kinase
MSQEKQREMLGLIAKETRQAQKLIDGLLELSRISHKELRMISVDTRRLVEEILVQQRQAPGGEAANGVRVELGELPAVQADPLLLRQVFANLISNAFKFTRTVSDPVVKVSARQEEGQWIFCVSDNGVGFAQEQKEKLFSIFQRLHPHLAVEGTGVGLVNVRKIVERHGGRVWAESKDGKGASFYFTLIVDRS